MKQININKFLVILIIIALSGAAAFAYTSDWSSFSSAAGSAESTGHKTRADMIGGGVVQGNASGVNNTFIGFLSGLIRLFDTTPPTIADFKIDDKAYGTELKDGDYIDKDAVLTAIVQDESEIDEPASQVGESANLESFSELSGDSSYVKASGALQYTFSELADGEYTIQISAYDNNGNSASESVTVKVSSVFGAESLYTYPQPYNPDEGNLRIEFQLSQTPDAPIDIFVFNQFKQLVYRRTIPPGAEGAVVGHNTLFWNGIDNFNKKLSPGIYFLKATKGQEVLASFKIVVMR
jgi:hypothetical protein